MWWEKDYVEIGDLRGRGTPPAHWTRYSFENDWFLRHIKTWSELLAPWFATVPLGRALEVGSYEGASTCWFLENLPAAWTLTVVDPWGPGPEWKPIFERFRDNVLQTQRPLRVLKARSRDYWAKPHSSFEFIYLDGDHSAANVENDVLQAWASLSPGGIILMDDYHHHDDLPGAQPAMDGVRAGVAAAMPQIGAPLERLGQCAMLRKRRR